MPKDLEQGKTGNTPDPSENANRTSRNEQNQDPGEGSYRNIETSVNNKEYFDEEYETEQDNKISEDEMKEERYGGTSKQ
jgi:hypothetical protein